LTAKRKKKKAKINNQTQKPAAPTTKMAKTRMMAR
jgi:hypothetical protein